MSDAACCDLCAELFFEFGIAHVATWWLDRDSFQMINYRSVHLRFQTKKSFCWESVFPLHLALFFSSSFNVDCFGRLSGSLVHFGSLVPR